MFLVKACMRDTHFVEFLFMCPIYFLHSTLYPLLDKMNIMN